MFSVAGSRVGSVVSVELALYHIDRLGRHFSPNKDENIRNRTTKRRNLHKVCGVLE